jgi:hypothetical protein
MHSGFTALFSKDARLFRDQREFVWAGTMAPFLIGRVDVHTLLDREVTALRVDGNRVQRASEVVMFCGVGGILIDATSLECSPIRRRKERTAFFWTTLVTLKQWMGA